MTILAKLKEVRIGLRAGCVTLDYPGKPRPAPPAFRGRPVFDVERCIGCGGCASNCPAREILVHDVCQEVRVIQYLGLRCTYCGRCADLCPEKAITLSTDYETATARPGDLSQRLELFMSTCQRCGRCFPAPTPLEQLKQRGYRYDDLERGRWIFRSRAILDEPVVDDLHVDLED